LFRELAERPRAAVRGRLTQTLGRGVTDAEVNALIAGLSEDTMRAVVTAWFPGGDSPSRSGLVSPQSVTTEPHGDGMPPNGRSFAFAPSGAWFHDEAAFAIRYRSSAHADPVLTGWLELLSGTRDLAKRPVGLAAFDELSRPTAPGLCVSCHSVEQAAANGLMANWRGGGRDSFSTNDDQHLAPRLVEKESRPLRTIGPRPFTKFSHGPHLVLPELADCSQCHALDDSADAAASYAEWDPWRFSSEFAPMRKQQCAQCHTATAAGDRCQMCHHYHVDPAESGSGVFNAR